LAKKKLYGEKLAEREEKLEAYVWTMESNHAGPRRRKSNWLCIRQRNSKASGNSFKKYGHMVSIM
jgi:hypothetical protein